MNSTRIATLFGPDDGQDKQDTSKPAGGNVVGHPLSQMASYIAPPKDVRRNDLLYRRFRNRLMAEFTAKDFTVESEIDGLAHDYVCLVEYRKARDLASAAPGSLTPQEQKNLDEIPLAERELSAIWMLLQQQCVNPHCTLEEAQMIAKSLRAYILRVENYFNQENEPEPEIPEQLRQYMERCAQLSPEPAPDPALKQRLAEYREEEEAGYRAILSALGELIGPLKDNANVEAILTGGRPVSDQGRAALMAVLQPVYEIDRVWLKDQEKLIRREADLKRQATAAQIANIDTLFRLDNQIRKLEEVIARKLKWLEKRQ